MTMTLDLKSLNSLSIQGAAGALSSFIEALVQTNLLYLEKYPLTLGLYASKIRYEDNEVWRDIPAVRWASRGSCHSLVAWRIAELRARKEEALVHIVYIKKPEVDLFHAQVHRGIEIEDPSRLCGMKV